MWFREIMLVDNYMDYFLDGENLWNYLDLYRWGEIQLNSTFVACSAGG